MKSDIVRDIYNRTAREYEEFVIPCKACQYAMLMQALELRGDERVLEVGCGPGQLSMEMALRLPRGHVLGIDISERMVEIAVSRAIERGIDNVEFRIGNVMTLDLGPNEFDVCVNSYLIHWLPDACAFLRNVRRALRDGGKLGIISPSPEWYSEIRQAYRAIMGKYREYLPEHVLREPIGVRIYGEDEMRELLSTCGFAVKKFISFRFMEDVPIEECLRRIRAKSGEAYLSFLPEHIRDDVRREFIREVIGMSKELFTTESGYIVVAVKR